MLKDVRVNELLMNRLKKRAVYYKGSYIPRCHVGSLNSSIVHPREVFKSAILNNATSVIVAHQHPSGDITPSKEDINVTRRLVDAGKLLGIEVLNHLLVNNESKFTSLKEKGLF